MSEQTNDECIQENSTLALNEIDKVLQKHFPAAKWNTEWRSVLGEDYRENPIWSLTVYVEANK